MAMKRAQPAIFLNIKSKNKNHKRGVRSIKTENQQETIINDFRNM